MFAELQDSWNADFYAFMRRLNLLEAKPIIFIFYVVPIWRYSHEWDLKRNIILVNLFITNRYHVYANTRKWWDKFEKIEFVIAIFLRIYAVYRKK